MRANFNSATRDFVWNKGTKISGKDAAKWRKDNCGALICYDDYGKISDYGWEIDHHIPLRKGGSNYLSNLFPLHWMNNKVKGDDFPYYRKAVFFDGTKNIVKNHADS